MNRSLEEYHRAVISGAERGVAAAALRGALRAAEPLYAALMAARNALYDRGMLPVRWLPRPVICIGNITTGGTGKTPLVAWLADKLRQRGYRPAVLLRGYRARPGQQSDEEALLDELLNGSGAAEPVPVCAGADRHASGMTLLKQRPDVGVFVMDDGFQHRRLGRDLDVVLMDSTNPWGYGHVLPQGLMRESAGGLRRAGAIVMTRVRADALLPCPLPEYRQRESAAGVFATDHVFSGVRIGNRAEPVEAMRSRRAVAFCGIANPDSFIGMLQQAGIDVVGSRAYPDHHAYAGSDLEELQQLASSRGAEMLITTAKDHVKLRRLGNDPADRGTGTSPAQSGPSAGAGRPSHQIAVAMLQIRFRGDDEARLLKLITATIESSPRRHPVP